MSNVIEVQSILDFRYLSIGKFGPFLRVVLQIDQYFMFLSLWIHESPGFFPQSLVIVLELKDLVDAADCILLFPGGLAITEILPFDHVESIDFYVEVKTSHVWQVYLLIWVLQITLAIAIEVKPVIIESAWVELFDIFFGVDVFYLFLSQEDVFLVELFHVQEVSFFFYHIFRLLWFLLAATIVRNGLILLQFHFSILWSFIVEFIIRIWSLWWFFGVL